MALSNIERFTEMNKFLPTIVICCSRDKTTNATRAIDLYTKGLSGQVRAHAKRCDVDDVLKVANVVILSAKHGFVHGGEVLEPYDREMTENTDVDSFVESISSTAGIFNSLNPNLPLMVFMTNNYLQVWDKMVDSNRILKNKLPNMTYVSRGHVGNLQLKSRLKKGLESLLEVNGEPTFFRSGVASSAELGYLDAGQAIGTSLAHCNMDKMKSLTSSIIDGSRTHKVFWDNGLITLLRKGKVIDTSWVFEQYKRLIAAAGTGGPNISIVIPDAPQCKHTALDLINKHTADIRWLAERCDVILPVHKYDDSVEFAKEAMQIIGHDYRIRLGVPCLENELDLLLPLDVIESLLQAKHNDKPLFASMHYFGLSDVSHKNKLHPRLLLAKMYLGQTDNSISLDACRTTALFGRGRKGDMLQKHIQDNEPKISRKLKINVYQAFLSPDDEDYQPELDGDTYNDLDTFDSNEVEQYMCNFWALLDDVEDAESIEAWFAIYGKLTENEGYDYVLNFDSDDIEGCIDVATRFVFTHSALRKIEQLWYDLFEAPRSPDVEYVRTEVRLTATEARRRAIFKLFQTHSGPLAA
ncbi:hypothetical protein ACEZNP_001609 [Vibrio parahaemolyticus]